MKDWIVANLMILRLAVGLAIAFAAIAVVLLTEWIRERLFAREPNGPATLLDGLALPGTKISSKGFDPHSPAPRGAANDSEPRAA